MNWKKTLLGLALTTSLSTGLLMAQAPVPPPGGPPIQLTDDQKARMKAVHDAFGKKMQTEHQVFESQLKSILNKSQLAILQEADARRAAFQQGEEKARQMLQKSGQPVPPDHPVPPMWGPGPGHDGPGPGGPPSFHHGPEGPGGPQWFHHGPEGPGGPGGAFGFDGPGREGHREDHDLMKKLNLTPEQEGEVHVFQESLMMRMHADAEAMRQQVEGILTPDQKAQMQRWHGPGRRDGRDDDDSPPPPPPPPPQ